MSPEVFESLSEDDRRGMWPNSLAMFGEAFAAQTGASAAHDRAIFKAMGLSVTPKSFVLRSTVPDRRPHGRQPVQVRRRFAGGHLPRPRPGARGVDDLPQGASSFTQYTLGNSGAIEGSRSILGWGSSKFSWNDVPWGSSGVRAALDGARPLRRVRRAASRTVVVRKAPGGSPAPTTRRRARNSWTSACSSGCRTSSPGVVSPSQMVGGRALDVPMAGQRVRSSFSAPAANEAVRTSARPCRPATG